jgi:hypothetical protein
LLCFFVCVLQSLMKNTFTQTQSGSSTLFEKGRQVSFSSECYSSLCFCAFALPPFVQCFFSRCYSTTMSRIFPFNLSIFSYYILCAYPCFLLLLFFFWMEEQKVGERTTV